MVVKIWIGTQIDGIIYRSPDEELDKYRPIVRLILKVFKYVTQEDEDKLMKKIDQLEGKGEKIMTILEERELRGIEKGKIEVARNLLSLGLDIDKIVKATGLSEEDIKKLLS